ncbi:lipid storage droplets surface-binding protein 1 [Bacillus rossius redtenbacheri]|uniref:lipid storage droplets surface-binding protein 1 n=1 Tax=Bacillus rossius redtenbacheri TaxID=93214 RepID=UPI002FDEDA7A
MLRRDLAQLKMAPQTQQRDFPHLQSVSRIARLPAVETGWLYASSLYTKLKRASPLLRWGLTTTESTVQGALGHAVAVAVVFEKQIHLADVVVCRGLDVVEERLPAIALAPVKVLVLTRDLVSSTLVRPVLKRADSVLASKYTSLAAEKIDSAIDIADKYVDQFLPTAAGESPGGGAEESQPDGKPVAVHTMRHVNRFSRKLRRRLTQRTLAEASALRNLSEELALALLQLAKLMATDPKAVRDKALALWAELSQSEPENQARPASLEGLVAMVTRELARRGVHLVNHASTGLAAVPRQLAACVAALADYVAALAEMLLQTWHLDKPKDQAIAQVRDQVVKFQHIVDQINTYITHVLVEVKGQTATRPAGSALSKMQERAVVSVRYGCAVQCYVVLTVHLSCADRLRAKTDHSKRKQLCG